MPFDRCSAISTALARLEFLNLVSVVAFVQFAVDARIDQVFDLAGVVNQIFSCRHVRDFAVVRVPNVKKLRIARGSLSFRTDWLMSIGLAGCGTLRAL